MGIYRSDSCSVSHYTADIMKKVLILGAGKSGLAAEALLNDRCSTVLWDDKFEGPKPQVSDFDELIMSPGIPLTHPMAAEAKKLGIRVNGELQLAYENCAGRFVGITGTNGKTTTTTLVGEIFKAAGFDTKVAGNIGLPVSSQIESAEKDTVMVTEISSFQLETISSFKPWISAILNITPDHLNRHGSFEEYARFKSLVCSNQDENSYFIYNAEDPVCVEIAKNCKAKCVAFSAKDNKPFAITDIRIPGKHNMENALAAAAICLCAGISEDVIRKTIAEFPGVEHRIEFVKEVNGVRYVNDSKGTNPDASVKAIEATYTPILLIAGGYDKHLDLTDFINSFNGKVKDLLLLGQTAELFRETALKCGFDAGHIHMCQNMRECVDTAYEIALPGDTVLLSPASASWGMYNNFEERGEDFKNCVKLLK